MSNEGLIPVPEDFDLGQTIRGFAEGQQVFGRYTLQRIVGRGGMGVVWLAVDGKLEREVALKFLPELIKIDGAALDDLKRETRRSLALTHPHIVRIYDFVDDPSAAAIAMEYVDGQNLSIWRVQQPSRVFEVDQIRAWTTQMCDALEYAHRKAKLVHRDLKPANLMIHSDGDLKVADFGIARSISDSVSRVTLQRGTSGTLAYMSPQQALGAEPSPQDDVYACGATLYELLTSKPPFYSGDLVTQLREIVPPTLAARRQTLGIEGHPIPEEWERTIASCLAKDPKQRPPGIAAMAHQLGLRGAPVTVGPVAPEAKVLVVKQSKVPTPQPSRGRKRAAIVAACVLFLIMLALGYHYGISVPAENARQAEIARQEAIQKEKEAQAKSEADAAEKARLQVEAQKAAAAAEALRTQQEKARQEADRLASARGGLMVKTEPEGASVTLGGEDAQTSPATFKSVKLGSYPIHISLDGYEPVDQTAEIKENQFIDLGTITLTHSKGSIQIRSTPAGLDYNISQNGTSASSGKTPATVPDLPTGNYDVVVTKGDWEMKDTVAVKRNETASYTPEFATGSLAINSTPPGASVMQGDKELGKTPLALNDLRPGPATHAVKLKGCKPASVSGTIRSNQQSSLSAVLQALPLIPEDLLNFLGTYIPIQPVPKDQNLTTFSVHLTYLAKGSLKIEVDRDGKLSARGQLSYTETKRFSTGVVGHNVRIAEITGAKWRNAEMILIGNFHGWEDVAPPFHKMGEWSGNEIHLRPSSDLVDEKSGSFLISCKKDK